MKLIRNLAFVRIALCRWRWSRSCSTARLPDRRVRAGRLALSHLRRAAPSCSCCRIAGAAGCATRALSVLTRRHLGPDVRLCLGAGRRRGRCPPRHSRRRSLQALRRLDAGAAMLPVPALEYWRHDEFGFPVRYDAPSSAWSGVALGVVVGRLVDMERGQAHDADERRPRRSACAMSSASGSICSRRQPRVRSARRSTSTAPGRSLGSCAACCCSTGRRSCSRKQAERACVATAGRRRGYLEPGNAITVPTDPRGGDSGGTHHLPDIAVEG